MERKKEILKKYQKLLQNVKEIKFFNQDLDYTTPWFIDCLADSREALINHLKVNNIGSRVMYPPINKQLAYNIEGRHPVSNIIGEKGLWLPSSVQLTNEQIKYICNEILDFYQ